MTEITKPVEGPVGIGGWMILPAIGTVIAPFVNIKNIFDDIRNYDKVPSEFHTAIATETVCGVVLLLVSCVALYLMGKRSHLFPKIFIARLAIGFAGILVTVAAYGGFGAPGGKVFAHALATYIVPSAIWIPYMLVSKRVANTFTK